MQWKFRAWLSLHKRPNSPQIPANLNSYTKTVMKNFFRAAHIAAILVIMLVTAVVAHAQTNDIPGSLPNLQLSNQSPGEMTISWDTAVPFASDYRMVWAEESLPFLSYAEPNEAGRGNEYPPGEARSITITNLTEGTTYKVRGHNSLHERRRKQRTMVWSMDQRDHHHAGR